MTETVLFVFHRRTSQPGHVGELLAERGYAFDRRCPCEGDALPEDLSPYAAVAVFGGAMSANDEHLDGIRAELDFIPRVLEARLPYIGICLGGQLLARVLGGRVAPHPEGWGESGFTRIHPTVAGREWFRESVFFYQAHREGFEAPASATPLAMGDMFSHQAFAYGDNAIATQFHPEVARETIDRWTMYGAHRLGRPGAQPRRAHLKGWELFAPGIDRWRRALLDRFGLRGPARMAEAAD